MHKPRVERVHPARSNAIIAQFSCNGWLVRVLSAEKDAQDRWVLRPKLKAHSIQFTLWRQMHALRVSQVAMRAQRLIVTCWLLRASPAVAYEAIAKRQIAAMGPEVQRVWLGRNEIRARHWLTLLTRYSNGIESGCAGRKSRSLKICMGYGMFCLCPLHDWNH